MLVLMNQFPDYFDYNISYMKTKLIWPLNFITYVEYYLGRGDKYNFSVVDTQAILERYLDGDKIPQETMDDLIDGIDYVMTNYFSAINKAIILDKFKHYKSNAKIAREFGKTNCLVNSVIHKVLHRLRTNKEFYTFVTQGYEAGKVYHKNNRDLSNFKTDEEKLEFLLSEFAMNEVPNVRTFNALKRAGYCRIVDLYTMDANYLLDSRIKNIGIKSAKEMVELSKYNFGFDMLKEDLIDYSFSKDINSPILYPDMNGELGRRIRELKDLGFSVSYSIVTKGVKIGSIRNYVIIETNHKLMKQNDNLYDSPIAALSYSSKKECGDIGGKF